MKRLSWGLLGLWAAAAAGCTIEAPDFAGKSCDSAADCPATFSCVAARPGALPCREEEYGRVLRAVEELLEEGSGGCICAYFVFC